MNYHDSDFTPHFTSDFKTNYNTHFNSEFGTSEFGTKDKEFITKKFLAFSKEESSTSENYLFVEPEVDVEVEVKYPSTVLCSIRLSPTEKEKISSLKGGLTYGIRYLLSFFEKNKNIPSTLLQHLDLEIAEFSNFVDHLYFLEERGSEGVSELKNLTLNFLISKAQTIARNFSLLSSDEAPQLNSLFKNHKAYTYFQFLCHKYKLTISSSSRSLI